MIKTPGVTNTTEAVPPSLGQPGAPWLVTLGPHASAELRVPGKRWAETPGFPSLGRPGP